ncbi:hypothetical protein [Leptospira sp. mild_001]|nr:hypothetical protein [Leptospira sp. mild_001]
MPILREAFAKFSGSLLGVQVKLNVLVSMGARETQQTPPLRSVFRFWDKF